MKLQAPACRQSKLLRPTCTALAHEMDCTEELGIPLATPQSMWGRQSWVWQRDNLERSMRAVDSWNRNGLLMGCTYHAHPVTAELSAQPSL